MTLFRNSVVIVLLLFTSMTYPCGTCYGDPNSSAVNGMNWAIISLLVTTGGVLSGISLSIFSIAKKSKNHSKKEEG